MNLHHDHETFSELIAASNELRIPPGIIEKDYYVTLALRELASRVKGILKKPGADAVITVTEPVIPAFIPRC